MRLLTCATYLFVVSLIASTVHADVVPPPPQSCPKGQVGVTSHSGPACVPQAPTDCSPGYRGQVGGKCVLASCHSDEQCDDAERCMDVDTCQEFRELHWTGWGWGAQRSVQRSNFFAGPPRPRPEGPPKKAWVELNICGQDGACQSPAECRPSSLCYPKSALGKTKAKVVELGTARRAAPPEEASTAKTGTNDDGPPQSEPPTSPTSSHGDAVAPAVTDGGGCRKGCSVAATRADAGSIGVPLWVLAVLLLRRRRTELLTIPGMIARAMTSSVHRAGSMRVLLIVLLAAVAEPGCNAILGMDERAPAEASSPDGGTSTATGGSSLGGGGTGGAATGGAQTGGGGAATGGAQTGGGGDGGSGGLGAGGTGGVPAGGGGSGGSTVVVGNDFSQDAHVVALYNFENGSLRNDSVGTNDLTAHNGVTVSTLNCQQGSGCVLFGVGGADWLDRVDTELSDNFPFKVGTSNDQYSVTFWVEPQALGQQDVLLGKVNWSNGDYRSWSIAIESTGQVLMWKGYNSGTQYETALFPTPFTAGRWYHVGVTYAESTHQCRIRVWDDTHQQLLDSDLVWNSTKTTSYTEAAFTIGAQWQGPAPFSGRMDEVVIFDRILTVDEIDAIRTGSFGAGS